MPQKIKKPQNTNWNLVNVLIAILLFFAGALITILFTFPSPKELSILKTEAEKREREVNTLQNKLKDEIDPSWHKKFNEQKRYYTDELSTKDNKLNQAEKKFDSILLDREITIKNNKNKRVFSTDQLRWIANKLAKGEYDSMELILVKQELKAYETLIKGKDSLIKAQKVSTTSLNLYINSLNDLIKTEELIIKHYEKTRMEKYHFWDLILVVFLIILLILSVLFLIKKEKFSAPN